MPIYKVGYRKWEGKKTSPWGRWWIIGETGFRLAFKSSWVKRVLFVCWLPIVIWGVCVFMVENQLEFHPELQQEMAAVTDGLIENDLPEEQVTFENFLEAGVLSTLEAAKKIRAEVDREGSEEIRFDEFPDVTARRVLSRMRLKYNADYATSPPIVLITVDDDGKEIERTQLDRDRLARSMDRIIQNLESEVSAAKRRANMTPEQELVDDFLRFVENAS